MLQWIALFIQAIARGIGNMVTQAIDAVKDFKTDCIWNLSIIASALACVVGLINFVVSYVRFLINRGYSEQIASIKENGAIETLEHFEMADTSIFDKTAVIILILLCMGFLFMIVSYFQNAILPMRILTVIDLIAMGTLFFLVLKGIGGNYIKGFWVLTIVAFILFVFFSEQRELAGYIFKALLISSIGFYIFLFLVESIIALVMSIIIAIFVYVMISIILKSLINNDGAGDYRNDSPSEYSDSGKKAKAVEKKQENMPIVHEYDYNAKVYIKENTWGKQVYVENQIGVSRHICSLAEYKAGKHIILLKGKKVVL